ncbi:nSTAND1 domain-containing NTPase [Nonomuraea sp. 3N208]|uniref:nSTAND1 domain-containing NTPase n=1 Tax=Nonomuraea sp. 3N208 TaxID=3457421 RepID=UPI003FCCFC37
MDIELVAALAGVRVPATRPTVTAIMVRLRRIVRRIHAPLSSYRREHYGAPVYIHYTELDGVADPSVIAGVLDRLAEARLIVLDEDTVQVAHEALIRAWPRLHRWLTDDRADLMVHRRLNRGWPTAAGSLRWPWSRCTGRRRTARPGLKVPRCARDRPVKAE